MELQIPHCVCAEISAQTVLRRKSKRDRRDFETAQWMERSKNSRSRSVPGSHPHAGGNPTENECGGIHRISQREKQFDDFSTTRESEVQIWESIILVPGSRAGALWLFRALSAASTTWITSSLRELQQVLPGHNRSQIQVLLRELRNENRAYFRGNTSAAKWFAGPSPAENSWSLLSNLQLTCNLVASW